ncbi:MAG: NUDIX domain-containing protein, partial [Lentisphaerae bacterium]|nr:NUDIX domain-containing protein [Lentisphaerota bacterium]
DAGEKCLDAALRELWEETGVSEKLVSVEAETRGLIRYDLPHDLVPAFAATLEAARTADLVLHVVDVSKPSWEADVRAVMETLETEVFKEDDDERPPILTVLNKVDCCEDGFSFSVEGIPISAKLGTHIEKLREVVAERLFPKSTDMSFTLPHQALYALHPFTAAGRARIVGYEESGACVEAALSTDEWRALKAVGAELNVSASCQDAGQ